MPFSLELAFDPESEARIKLAWAEASKFYKTNLMLTHGVVPHVALVVMDRRFQSPLSTIRPQEFPIDIGPIEFFQNGKVAFFKISNDLKLIRYQKIAFDAVANEGGVVDQYYTPTAWVPHCSLAQECSGNINIPMDHVPFTANVNRIIQVQYPPTQVIDQLSQISA